MSTQEPSGEGQKPLVGTEEATIDDKGRILMGKKKRERLGRDFTIGLGALGCLVAYPQPVWQRLLTEIFSHDSTNLGRAQYSRLTLGLAEDELNFDAQGRVVVPRMLRDRAKLTDKVLLIGCGDRLEIWSKPEYEVYLRNPDGYGLEHLNAVERAQSQMVGR